MNNNTFAIDAATTLQAAAKIIQQAQDAAEHDNLIDMLKQDRLNAEGEASSTGAYHARRILKASPDYSLLCRMLDESKELSDPDNVCSFPDGDPTIADHDFQMDLMEYPEALQASVFAGFYAEAIRIHSEVTA